MTLRAIVATVFLPVLAAAGLAAAASAAPLLSGSGSATCELNAAVFGSSACMLRTVSPHAAWQQPGAGHLAMSGAAWISYADTGIGGTRLAPTPHDTSATPGQLPSVPWLMKVSESFVVGDGGGGIVLRAWADDTADVYLNDVLVQSASFTQDVCAAGAMGCEPDEFLLLNQDLVAGDYKLDFYVYQLGTGRAPDVNPFGLIYSGDVANLTAHSIPAPAGLALFGLALLGLGLTRRP